MAEDMAEKAAEKIIAFQGERGAYSALALAQVFPEGKELPCATFEEAIHAVGEGRAHYAMLPIENSQWGRVADIHHLLPDSGLHIIGEHFLPIRHQLLGLPGTNVSEIKTVRSHPQALGQCRQTLRRLDITSVAFEDTAGAARWVSEQTDKSQGALASTAAAALYGLDILMPDMQDVGHNTTRFLVMSPQKSPLPPVSVPTMMTAVFQTRNIPAALYKALGGFATNAVNITKIESYQLEGRFQAAQFYIDIEGHPATQGVQNAFEELSFFTDNFRILGIYPAHAYRQEGHV